MTLEDVATMAALYLQGGTKAVAVAYSITRQAARNRLRQAGISLGSAGRRPGRKLSLAVELLEVYREAGVPLTLSTAARWCGRPTTQVQYVYAQRYGRMKRRVRCSSPRG